MIKTDEKLNFMLMEDMGLAEGEGGRVIDVEDGEICCIGTKELIVPGGQKGRGLVEFDPINNPRQMNTLFMQFIDKLSQEEAINGCVSFGTYQVRGSEKNIARIVTDDGQIIESRPYKTEGLCFVELVKKLNGDEDPQDLSKYDSLNRKKPTTKPRRK